MRLQAKQWDQAVNYLVHDRNWRDSDRISTSGLPVDATEMVGQHDASDRQPGRQLDFERIAFHLAGDRAGQGKSGATVVRSRGQHKSRTTAGLLPAGLRIERQPDEVTTVGDVWLWRLP